MDLDRVQELEIEEGKNVIACTTQIGDVGRVCQAVGNAGQVRVTNTAASDA
jgi:hypothetical protein